MIAYADTGFLISLYGEDDLSSAATALIKSKPLFLVTPLVEAEFTNACHLRVFRKQWTRTQSHAVQDLFRQHAGAGVLRREDLRSDVWQAALRLSRRHTSRQGTRTLDLLHVATVLVFKPDVFFTFDERQRRVAKAERLPVLPT